jgi:RND family efflux transporter MFP subunit
MRTAAPHYELVLPMDEMASVDTRLNGQMTRSFTVQAETCSDFREKQICVLLLMAALVFTGCGSSGKATADEANIAPTVGVVKVTRKDLGSTLEIASELQPFQEVNVYAKVSGYIHKVYVDWGSHVRTGDLLAVLEIPELQQQLELDQAAVRRSENDLTRAREDLAQANSKFQVTDLTYKRLSTVMQTKPGLVAQEEVDVAEGKDLEAKAGVSGAQAAVAGSEQALAISRASLEKDRALFAYSRITAPFDGVVTGINAYTGALLPAGTSSTKADQSLCRLSQTDLLRLVIPLPERAVPDIHQGQSVAVQVSSKNEAFEGKIVRFSGQIDTETRTMHTEVNVPNPKYELVPGMYASVRIPLHTVKNALTVPAQAVQPGSEGHGTVLVVNSNNRIEKRDVTLGLESATDKEILSGLRENEMVVFGEQSVYKPGQLVTPRAIQPSEME